MTKKPLISIQSLHAFMNTKDLHVRIDIGCIVPLLAKYTSYPEIAIRAQNELRRPEIKIDPAAELVWRGIHKLACARYQQHRQSAKAEKPEVPKKPKANPELQAIVNMVMTQYNNGMDALSFIKECAGAMYHCNSPHLFGLLQNFNPETYGLKVLTYGDKFDRGTNFYYRDDK